MKYKNFLSGKKKTTFLEWTRYIVLLFFPYPELFTIYLNIFLIVEPHSDIFSVKKLWYIPFSFENIYGVLFLNR